MKKPLKIIHVRIHRARGRSPQAFVMWSDASVTMGEPTGEHMKALLARAKREGVKIHRSKS